MTKKLYTNLFLTSPKQSEVKKVEIEISIPDTPVPTSSPVNESELSVKFPSLSVNRS